MGTYKDLSGQRFGKLTVIKRNGTTNNGKVIWECICDCGNSTKVTTCSLRTGNTRSCGCLYKQSRKEIKTTHGLRHHPLYSVWLNIKQRCLNPNSTSYKRYGGRGITICDEWKNDFKSFYDWSMENGYQKNLTIDRIDVNGNYEPNNCRWTTIEQQANNKRNNHYLEYDNKRLTMSQWSKQLNLPRTVILYRLKLGWSVEKTLTTPVRYKK